MSLLPGVSQESVPLLHRTVRPLLQDADMHLQKKAYQVLRRICEYFMDYVLQHLDELQQDILDSLVSCAPPAKKVGVPFFPGWIHFLASPSHLAFSKSFPPSLACSLFSSATLSLESALWAS